MPTYKTTTSTVIPVIRYNDAYAAIEWLCTVIGFEKHLVVPAENNTVIHSQLTFGNGMVMVGSVRDGEPDPGAGSIGTGICLIVNDADEVYARAKSAGAAILRDIEDQDFGGRAFSCSDIEGHIWHVGTYDPWAE